jgi:hypothetical protein
MDRVVAAGGNLEALRWVDKNCKGELTELLSNSASPLTIINILSDSSEKISRKGGM